MKIKIALFASARSMVGASTVELELPEPATMADVKRELLALHPVLEDLAAKSLFSMDHEYVTDETPITSNAELAMIPPVSGG